MSSLTGGSESLMADVFSLLKKDHAAVKKLLDDLEAGAATGSLVDQLVMAESGHEAAEEMYFWPAVREKAVGGGELADEALTQERQAKRVLEDLSKAAPGMPVFDSLAKAFAEAARQHIAFEEETVMPALEGALTTEERNRIGAKMMLAKKLGPTRPHPHGPDRPLGLKTVGAVAAVADRAADVILRRNRA